MTDTLYARVVSVDEKTWSTKAFAQGMEWDLVQSPFKQSEQLKVGDIVGCYVFSDEVDDFYLEVRSGEIISEEMFQDQEEAFKVDNE